jgi:hypothetical protein
MNGETRSVLGDVRHAPFDFTIESLEPLMLEAKGTQRSTCAAEKGCTCLTFNRNLWGRSPFIGPGAVVQDGKWFYFVNTYHELGARDMPEDNKLTPRVMRVF